VMTGFTPCGCTLPGSRLSRPGNSLPESGNEASAGLQDRSVPVVFHFPRSPVNCAPPVWLLAAVFGSGMRSDRSHPNGAPISSSTALSLRTDDQRSPMDGAATLFRPRLVAASRANPSCRRWSLHIS
jgi:hypothetical protein